MRSLLKMKIHPIYLIFAFLIGFLLIGFYYYTQHLKNIKNLNINKNIKKNVDISWDVDNEVSKERFVTALNGLILRKGPHKDCEEIITIPFNSSVYIDNYSSNKDTFEGITDVWASVRYGIKIKYGKYKKYNGWVFNGFLSLFPDRTKISKDEYKLFSKKGSGEIIENYTVFVKNSDVRGGQDIFIKYLKGNEKEDSKSILYPDDDVFVVRSAWAEYFMKIKDDLLYLDSGTGTHRDTIIYNLITRSQDIKAIKAKLEIVNKNLTYYENIFKDRDINKIDFDLPENYILFERKEEFEGLKREKKRLENKIKNLTSQ